MKNFKFKVIILLAIISISLPYIYCKAFGTDTDKLEKNKFIHVSIDDTSAVFTDLAANKSTYKSIFDNPILAYYKQLHDTYGAVISLYCYLTPLSKNCDDLVGYSQEFKDNSSWLKFGLHAQSDTTKYTNSTYNEALNDWNAFVSDVVKFTGTTDCIDRFPRLHYFAGSLEALKGFRDAKYGAVGFLAADDQRNSYYLTDLNENVILKDYKLKLESGKIINGKSVSDKTRLRTKKSIKILEATKISITTPGKYKIAYTEYTDKGKFVYQSMFYNDTVTLSKTGYYKFMIISVSGSDNLSKSASKVEKLFKITNDFNKMVYNHDFGYDSTNKLYFTRTDFRMESVSDITKTISDLKTAAWENQTHPLIIFTHEVQLGSSDIKSKIEKFLQYAVDNGYSFDYPQNRFK